jgi:hypothetical protein
LGGNVGLQGLVCDALNKAVAESLRHDAKSSDVFGGADVLNDIRVCAARMNQLTSRGVNKRSVGHVTGTELHLLAECARVYRLVTSDASHIVIGWPESVGDSFFFLEDELIVFESAVASSSRRLSVRHAFVDRRPPGAEVVE